MIPRIDSYAATYPATTSFHYTYDNYDYYFYFSGEVDSPSDYRFDESVCDYVIEKAAEGLNLSISSGLGAKINWFAGIVTSSVFDFCRNYMIAVGKFFADWIISTSIYGFEFQFTGIDSSYPGYETYGDAYGWRFIGWMGEKIDLVLDSQGMLYGSNPIGNYTFSDDQQDFGIWSIHQHDGDDIWMPSLPSVSFNDLLAPYFVGSTLNFYVYSGSTYSLYQIPDFYQCALVSNNKFFLGNSGFWIGFLDSQFIPDRSIYIDGVPYSLQTNSDTFSFKYNNVTYYGKLYARWMGTSYDSFLPSRSTGTDNNVNRNLDCTFSDHLGYYSGAYVNGSVPSIWLNSLSTTDLPVPIVLPVDDPIPVSDIEPDPIDFTPDPDPDPDPVPGIDYPVPGPVPIPVPPLPPIVSGNDDLWPDLNEVFTIEVDLDGFLGGLSNFQFTPLRTLVEGFTSALTWVSTIMMLLYDGSDFSILFVVLSVFFIASALLGIYKWWSSR